MNILLNKIGLRACITCLLVLTAWDAWSQTGAKSGLQRELGLLVSGPQLNGITNVRGSTTSNRHSAYQLRPYLLLQGPKSHFFRFTAGFSRESDTEVYSEENPAVSSQFSDSRQRNVDIHTGFSYGWAIAPFNSGFGQRMDFRLGVSLRHSFAMRHEFTQNRVFWDSVAVIKYEDYYNSIVSGEQQLSVGAFAQANIRVWKSLHFGLEFVTDIVGIGFGRQSVVTQTAFFQNGVAMMGQIDRNLGRFGFEVLQNFKVAPAFQVAWRF